MTKLTKQSLKDIQNLIRVREGLAADIDKLNQLRYKPYSADVNYLTYSNEEGVSVNISAWADVGNMIHPLLLKLLSDRLELVDQTLRALNVIFD